jgi:hypothetical protein
MGKSQIMSITPRYTEPALSIPSNRNGNCVGIIDGKEEVVGEAVINPVGNDDALNKVGVMVG